MILEKCLFNQVETKFSAGNKDKPTNYRKVKNWKCLSLWFWNFILQPGLIGLVDYPEDDSDEEEEDGSDVALGPSPKRQRLAT